MILQLSPGWDMLCSHRHLQDSLSCSMFHLLGGQIRAIERRGFFLARFLADKADMQQLHCIPWSQPSLALLMYIPTSSMFHRVLRRPLSHWWCPVQPGNSHNNQQTTSEQWWLSGPQTYIIIIQMPCFLFTSYQIMKPQLNLPLKMAGWRKLRLMHLYRSVDVSTQRISRLIAKQTGFSWKNSICLG